MFQDFALFPHMNVAENVAFGLHTPLNPPIERTDGGRIGRGKVVEMLELVGLPGFERRDVNTLSGGEQQRVALARSLAPHPHLLMLDEPLGSLDRDLRERLIGDLRLILHRMHQTAVYVTHDQAEAFAIADRLVVMKAAAVEQVGTPQEIFNHPASPFVAGFIGLTNLIDGTATTEEIVTPIGRFRNHSGLSGPVTVLIRPEKAHLSGEASCALEGIVSERSFRGQAYHMVLEVGSVRMAFDLPSNEPVPTEGEKVKVCLDEDTAVQAFPRGNQTDLPAS
jgi:ABC-type Fe3+/spermidine/putrescine transport system ATPase subunit